MKKLIGITAVISGVLLIVVPRYILPACEYQGFPAMHCSDTARGEMVAGSLLLLVGVATLFMKQTKTIVAGGILALALSIVSFVLPDRLGYCHSTRMPCNYGMVPGIRFIAVVSGLIMITGLIGAVRGLRKKGTE